MEKFGEMKKYDKLVRDNIPDIIKSKGEECVARIAEQQEYAEKLREKLLEEVNEYLESGDKKELADILEVLHAICETEEMTWEDLEQMREEKLSQRGGFSKKIILEQA